MGMQISRKPTYIYIYIYIGRCYLLLAYLGMFSSAGNWSNSLFPGIQNELLSHFVKDNRESSIYLASQSTGLFYLI